MEDVPTSADLSVPVANVWWSDGANAELHLHGLRPDELLDAAVAPGCAEEQRSVQNEAHITSSFGGNLCRQALQSVGVPEKSSHLGRAYPCIIRTVHSLAKLVAARTSGLWGEHTPRTTRGVL